MANITIVFETDHRVLHHVKQGDDLVQKHIHFTAFEPKEVDEKHIAHIDKNDYKVVKDVAAYKAQREAAAKKR